MGKGIFIDVKTTVYPLEAIYSASYQFIDRAYVRLDEKSKNEIRVHLEPKGEKSDKGFGKLGGEFQNELIHQCVRTQVAQSNKKIREYIVTRALLSAQPATDIPAGFPGASAPDGMVSNAPGPDGVPNVGPDGQPIPNVPDGDVAMVDQRADDPSPGANLDKVNRKATPSDDALAGEIQKLLSEIDSGGDAEDPLGITAPWEEKHEKANGREKPKAKSKSPAKKKAKKDSLADEIKALLEAEANASGGGEGK